MDEQKQIGSRAEESTQPQVLPSAAVDPLLEIAPQLEAEFAPEPEVPQFQYCIFRAGRERFCFSVLDVEEVVEWPRLTRIPLAPSFLMGIFNLRGTIVPVVDIAVTEGRRSDLQPRHVVVATLKLPDERDDLRMGIAADEVIGTHGTSDPLVPEEAPRNVPHCCGIVRHDDRMALVLDLKKLTETFPVPVI